MIAPSDSAPASRSMRSRSAAMYTGGGGASRRDSRKPSERAVSSCVLTLSPREHLLHQAIDVAHLPVRQVERHPSPAFDDDRRSRADPSANRPGAASAIAFAEIASVSGARV